MSAASYKITEMIPSTSAHLIDRSKVSLSYKTINTVVSSLYHQKNVKCLIDSASAVLHWTTWLMHGLPKERWFRSMLFSVNTSQNPGRFRFNKNSGLKFRKLNALNGTVYSGRTDPTQAHSYTVYILKNTWLSKRGGGKLKAEESYFV